MLRKILFASSAPLVLAACGTVGEGAAIETAESFAIEAADRMEAEQIATNPVLAEWPGVYQGVPQWQDYTVEQVDAAYPIAIDEYLGEIMAIAENPEPPTWENTIDPLELSGETLGRVQTIHGLHQSNLSNPEVQALTAKWSPRLSAVFDQVTLNPKLFARIKSLHDRRDSLNLTDQQMRVLTRRYESYVRGGALLDDAGKAQLSEYNQQLAGLFSEFSNRVLADEQTFTAVPEARMEGVPADVKSAARALAESNGLGEGVYAIRNTRSMVDPVLSGATDRALRQDIWQKFVNRGDNGDANDTNDIIRQIVQLRAQRADLLGYDNHAEWRMQDTMAGSPERAMDLMNRVWPAAVARVDQEVEEMMEFASADGVSKIEPWDYLYYLERLREAKYDLSADELKPYFELNNMVEGMFWSAEQLYDLKLTENTGQVPVYHPDIRTFEVTHAKSGEVLGVFYFDTYARDGKRSGAWMNSFRLETEMEGGRPGLWTNNNNFNKPGPGEPVLISLDDAATLWHEFGHAIHYMLVDVDYPSLTGAQRDFVEYPSQVNENWLLSKPILERFAVHYETGEPMPQELLDKIEASSTFGEGYATVQYLSSALVDMALHTDPDGVEDIDAFERETLAALGMPEETVMRHRLPQFNHLFSSDSYSAGYYSYLWSETMDADTWAYFESTGDVYDRRIADAFRIHVLATGNATDRAEAYRKFRGRDPEVEALLERRGFPTGGGN